MPPTTSRTISSILNNRVNFDRRLELLNTYITEGNDVNEYYEGSTMLSILASLESEGREEDNEVEQLIRRLLIAGADPRIKGLFIKNDAIYSAIKQYNSEIAALLLEFPNINLNETFEGGKTYLHGATENGDIDTVRILLEKGANPNKKDE